MDWKELVPVALAVVGLFTAMVTTLCWVVKKLVSKFSADMCKTQAGTDALMNRTMTLVENHFTHSTETISRNTLAVENLVGHMARETDALTRLVTRIDKALNGKLKHGKKQVK